jgi:hypothetical protein
LNNKRGCWFECGGGGGGGGGSGVWGGQLPFVFFVHSLFFGKTFIAFVLMFFKREKVIG